MYILDTNVISELRKAKKTHPNVKKWAEPCRSASLGSFSSRSCELGIKIILR